MTLLASKQMYCINEKVRNNPNISVDDYCGYFNDIEDLGGENEEEDEERLPNSECKEESSLLDCKYHSTSRIQSTARQINCIFDRDWLMQFCKEKKACPYVGLDWIDYVVCGSGAHGSQ